MKIAQPPYLSIFRLTRSYFLRPGVTTEPELQLTEPKRLFGGADSNINIQKGWSVSSDGQRILGVRAVTTESDTRRIAVVENWYLEFEKP